MCLIVLGSKWWPVTLSVSGGLEVLTFAYNGKINLDYVSFTLFPKKDLFNYHLRSRE